MGTVTHCSIYMTEFRLYIFSESERWLAPLWKEEDADEEEEESRLLSQGRGRLARVESSFFSKKNIDARCVPLRLKQPFGPFPHQKKAQTFEPIFGYGFFLNHSPSTFFF